MNNRKILSSFLIFSLLTSLTNPNILAKEKISNEKITDRDYNTINENKFTFDKKSGTITKYIGEDKNIVIPNKIKGEAVKKIGKKAFFKTKVEKVTISEGIETIESGAFLGVNSLKEINFPNSLKKIGEMSFFKTSLSEIKLDEGLLEIGKRAFSNCSNLAKINFPNTLTKVEDSAFEKCKINSNINLGENFTHLGNRVFYQNKGNIEINISEKGKKIYLHDEIFNIKELKIPQNREIMLFARAFCDKNCYLNKKITLDLGKIEVNKNKSNEEILKILNEKIKLKTGFVKVGKKVDGSDDTYLETGIDWEIKRDNEKVNVVGKFKKFPKNIYTEAKQNKELIEKVLDNYNLSLKIKENEEKEVNNNFTKEDFTYKIIENKLISKRNYLAITGLNESGKEKIKKNKKLVIPETIFVEEQGKKIEKKVEGIAPNSFKDLDITSLDIKINEGYKEYIIDTGAFKNNKIKEFKIPLGTKFIESYAFKNNQIKNLFIPESVVKVGNESFANNEMTNLKISDDVKNFQFDSYSFAYNKIKEVDLPFSIFKLLQNVFFEQEGYKEKKVKLYTRNKRHLEVSTYINPYSDYHEFKLVGEKVNRINLRRSIEYASSLLKEDYKEESFLVLEEIKLKAKEIMKKHSSNQKEIDDATKKLNDAIKKLIPNGVSKKELIKNISRLENLSDRLYEQISYNNLLKTIEEAKTIYNKKDASQEAIDKINKKLKKAEKNLVFSEEAKYKKEDFLYKGSSILGFSDKGKEKFEYNKYLVIPEKTPDNNEVLEISDNAFLYDGKYDYTTDTGESKNGLISVILPKNIKRIGKKAFQKNRLENVKLPESLQEIDSLAFNGNNLQDIIIPDNVVKMGDGVFSLNDIKKAKLSKNFKKVPNGIFSRNIHLENIEIPYGVTSIGQGAFTGCPLKQLKIPSSVKVIEKYAFLSHRLETLEIPSSVEEIKGQAFASNKKFRYLKNLILHEGIKKIEKDAFKSSLIEEVEIPSSLEKLDKNAFNDNMDSKKNIIKVKVYTYNKNHLNILEKGINHEIIFKNLDVSKLKDEKKKALELKEDKYYKDIDKKEKEEFEYLLKESFEIIKNPTSKEKYNNIIKELVNKNKNIKEKLEELKKETTENLTNSEEKPNVIEGWKQNDYGWWYQRANGTYPVSEWEIIGGKWYHFDTDGYMQTGWLNSDGSWYYLKTDGSMAKDTWIDETYYVDENGSWVIESWKQNDYGWWYQRSNGTYPVSEWEIIGGKWYYFDINGYMLVDTITPDGYYIDTDGACIN